MDTLNSWNHNAGPWIDAVRSGSIRSRKVATDAAVVAAIARLKPQRVLDVGCGEGWLMRRLHAELGCSVTGVDGCAELIRASTAEGSLRGILASYSEIEARPECVEPAYDVVVCNFALLDESIAGLLRALRQALSPHGSLVIQTVHPWTACGEYRYENGWRTERFESFGNGHWVPMHWYFRTLASWLQVLHDCALCPVQVEEPVDPESGRPLSLLLTARAR